MSKNGVLMQGWKNNNDPWVPLSQTNGGTSLEESCEPVRENGVSVLSNGVLQSQPPQNPLHQLIDSERYLETLEEKLEKLKSRKKEPTSKDIITSLALFQEDQMKRYVNCDSPGWTDGSSGAADLATSSSFLARKFHPEQQALTAEELLELIKSDVVSKVHEEDNFQQDDTSDAAQSSNLDSLKQGNKTSDNENWANFDQTNEEVNSVDNFNEKTDR